MFKVLTDVKPVISNVDLAKNNAKVSIMNLLTKYESSMISAKWSSGIEAVEELTSIP